MMFGKGYWKRPHSVHSGADDNAESMLASLSRQCVPCKPAHGKLGLAQEGRLTGHKERVFDLSWSPSAQTPKLASVGQTGGLVWTVDGGAATAEPVKLAGSEVMRVCWHFDGTHVLTGNSSGQIEVFAANNGAVAATLEAGGAEKDEVYGLQMLSSDGLLAAGTSN